MLDMEIHAQTGDYGWMYSYNDKIFYSKVSYYSHILRDIEFNKLFMQS